VALRHAKALPASTRPDGVAFGQLVTGCTDRLALLERYWQEAHLVSADQPVHRFSEGRIPEGWVPECEQLAKLLRAIGSQVAGIAAALKEPDDAKPPAQREAQSHTGVELGVYLARLGTLDKLLSAWATHDRVPWAKWISGPRAQPALRRTLGLAPAR
jgi:ATP-dependent DNA helicase DinG